MRGAAEAQATDQTTCGITFDGNYAILTGYTGSVSAGAVGQANTSYYGVASAVGGGTAGGGDTENGSASCPVTPLWI
jgi:hypothetical protein